MHSKANIDSKPLKKQMIADYVAERYKNGRTLQTRITAWHDIKNHFDWIGDKMPRLMQELLRDNLISCVGSARDAGRIDIRPIYRVYAPHGTQALQHVPLPREVKPVKYKGIKTPPHYSEWRTPEITPETYDIYAGRNLAMLAR